MYRKEQGGEAERFTFPKVALTTVFISILPLATFVNAQEIVDSHAISGDELVAHPEESWVTNGGTNVIRLFLKSIAITSQT